MAAELVSYPLTTRGLRTRVLEAGEGDRAILFLHGLGARADRWRRNLGPLALSGYRCIAVDMPGHGFADKGPDTPVTVQALADYIGAVAKALGLQRTLLVGTSLGAQVLGRVALDAARHPQGPPPGAVEVCGLMLIGPLGLLPLAPPMAAAIRNSVVETSIEAIRRKLAFVMKIHDGITPTFVREEFMINNSEGAHASFVRLGEALVAQTSADVIGAELAELAHRLPLSLLWGALDEAVPPSIGLEAHDRTGLPRPELVDGAGHAPYWERAEVFNDMLRAFAARAFGGA